MTGPSDPQRFGRILHQAMQEVLGQDGHDSVLAVAGTANGAGAEFTEAGRFSIWRLHEIFGALEQKYGVQASRGLALRIGRACLPYGLREYGDALGIATTSFRLLPFPVKLNKFAASLAGLFNGPAGEGVRLEQQPGRLLWSMDRCPFCEQGQPGETGCLLPLGVAEEALYWLSGGKMFSVAEITCIARGDSACTLQLDQTPLS